jgi:uncharacterized membrane protein YcaP (DUF421 family)
MAALLQALLALGYYAAIVLLMRLSGKRLAGQTTTFDLVVVIGLAVTLQTALLRPGSGNAIIFVCTVFAAHRSLAVACARSRKLRRLVRGAPRPLVFQGQVSYRALEEENLSYDELLAGLRKLGFAHPSQVQTAVLEETGHISAISAEEGLRNPLTGSAPPARDAAEQSSATPEVP